jgi:hypothetical protein
MHMQLTKNNALMQATSHPAASTTEPAFVADTDRHSAYDAAMHEGTEATSVAETFLRSAEEVPSPCS